MGYNLYITRRRRWSDEGRNISLDEWKAFVESDTRWEFDPEDPATALDIGSELDWLIWTNGNLYTKNPGESLIVEMARIAELLDAIVQGEDGETYGSSGVVHPPKQPGVFERLSNWWDNRTRSSALPADVVECPFRVGDRVRDIFGDQCTGTITKVDASTRDGMGLIVVNYDDGRVGKRYCMGHGLSLLEDDSSDTLT